MITMGFVAEPKIIAKTDIQNKLDSLNLVLDELQEIKKMDKVEDQKMETIFQLQSRVEIKAKKANVISKEERDRKQFFTELDTIDNVVLFWWDENGKSRFKKYKNKNGRVISREADTLRFPIKIIPYEKKE
jgi:hypothetical protein